LVIESLYPGAYQAKLENGLRILVDEVPQSRSVAVGIGIRVGSRDDPSHLSGLSHFIEHLVFKGTETRDAITISQQIDSVGGHLNAATGKEATFFYAETPAEGLETALGILADLVLHPRFAPGQIDLERNVVLEEIRGHEDDPEESAYDLFAAGLWRGGHPLSRSVLGTQEAIRGARREEISAHHVRHYQPDNMVLVICGAVKVERVIESANQLFPKRTVAPDPGITRASPTCHPQRCEHDRPTGQAHVYFALQGPPAHSEDRFPLEVANSILGDGPSSRLFRAIREERGLAYVVTSHLTCYSDVGLWLTYAGIAPKTTGAVIDLIRAEFARLQRESTPSPEFRLAKQKLRGHLILGMETNWNRAAHLGTAAIQKREILSPDQLLVRLDQVTRDDVRRVLDAYLRPEVMNLTIVGPTS